MVTGVRLFRLCTVVALLLGTAVPSGAQPIRDRILSDVRVVEQAECAIVRVVLKFPVRYVSHFPLAFGDELRIMVRPIAVSAADRNALIKRESARAPVSERAAIEQIVYEGDTVAGPTVTLFFRHAVAFKVGQGADFRSLIIAISGTTPSDACRPESAD